MKNYFAFLFFFFLSYNLFSQIALPTFHGALKVSNQNQFQGTSATFTNCGKTGINGPSQGDCNTAYSGSNLQNFVTVNNGIQEWIVPQTRTYIIEVWGARGGGRGYSCTNGLSGTQCLGASGARMKGEFNLTQGEILRIAVGQMGQDYSNYGGGGGGGTFVAKGNNHGSATPLIIAGGGGGGHRSNQKASIPGQITETSLQNDSNWSSGCDYGVGGGGSWFSDGAPSSMTCYSPPAQGGKGWASYLVGGNKSGGNNHWARGDGGFGGGGGGAWGGGPAGGYRAPTPIKHSGQGITRGGGGGGSFNSGANQDNTIGGGGDSHGKVEISW